MTEPTAPTVAPEKPLVDVQTAVQDVRDAKPSQDIFTNTLTPVLGGEPAVIIGGLVAVVIAVLSLTGVVSIDTANGIVASVAPLVTGVIARFFVSPVRKP